MKPCSVRAGRWRPGSGVVIPALVFAVAAAARLRMLFRPSPFFYGTYDDGVHFAVALNLVHGQLPYRDVLFLQPPGIVLAAGPFAMLAPLVGDARAFVLARIAFALIGAVNAVLVVLLLRRSGRAAQLTGGLLYALSFPAIYTERTISLEVLGTTGVLASLLLLRHSGSQRRWPLLAGIAAGTAIGFKVWYVIPFLILAVAAWRRAVPFLIGGAVAGCAIYLPFFLPAPQRMWQQIVVAQLGRPDQGITVMKRLRSIIGVDSGTAAHPWWQVVGDGGTIVLLVLLAVMLALTLATPGERIFGALLIGSCGLLLISPSYLQHYATLTAGPFALVGGVGTARVVRALRVRWAAFPVVVAVAVLALASFSVQDLDVRSQKVLPRAALQAAASRVHGCVVADDPTVLILINRFSRDLDRGCRLQADPSGINFTLTTPGRPQLLRPDNPAFQREILQYFRSNAAYLWVRGEALGLSPATERVVRDDRVLFRTRGLALRTAH